MSDNNNSQPEMGNDEGVSEPSGDMPGGEDLGPKGGGPQPGQSTGGGGNTVFIILLILIVLVIGFLLFSSDSAESPTNGPATATDTPPAQPMPPTENTTGTDQGTTSEADEGESATETDVEAPATGTTNVEPQ